jgi:hypothetical protein
VVRQSADELVERGPDLDQVSEVIEVVRLDAGDHRDFGPVIQEAAVILVGLDDHRPIARSRAVRVRGRIRPDQSKRVQPCLIQQPCDECRRRGLPVRSGYGHAVASSHQLTDGFGQFSVRQAPSTGFEDFGVRGRYGGRPDDVFDVVGQVGCRV